MAIIAAISFKYHWDGRFPDHPIPDKKLRELCWTWRVFDGASILAALDATVRARKRLVFKGVEDIARYSRGVLNKQAASVQVPLEAYIPETTDSSEDQHYDDTYIQEQIEEAING
jgi:hypothetical protein